MPARAATRCANCGGVIYFNVNDDPPQRIICDCRETHLSEEGPVGNWEALTQEEFDAL